MGYDREFIAGNLRRWEKYLLEFNLPEWKTIPDIGLYMEQVASLLKMYLDYLPPELKEEQFITPATVNNYVRKKIMPQPVKKKYYRRHIAYLIIICTMKHCLTIPTLQTLLPNDLSDEALEALYTAYAQRHRLVCGYFVDEVKKTAAGILGEESDDKLSTASTEELIITSAVISGFARLLAEKLMLLDGKGPGDTEKKEK